MIQTTHPFFDNNPPFELLPGFVREWNERSDVLDGEHPRLRIATPAEWWEVVEEREDELATHRGDWTDFWNFGTLSTARETAINRENRRRLGTADALEAVLTGLGSGIDERPPARRTPSTERERARWAIAFFDEHTWGADVSVEEPEDEDTQSQWNYKANYAYEGRSLSLLQRRDAIAELARHAAGWQVNGREDRTHANAPEADGPKEEESR